MTGKTIHPGTRHGIVVPPASKSFVHRLLVLAAAGKTPVRLLFDGLSDDIEATVRCLGALGAAFGTGEGFLDVHPAAALSVSEEVSLACGESASTLRFLLPFAAVKGIPAAFSMEGRLPDRPIRPLTDTLEKNGARIRVQSGVLHLSGRLCPGEYALPGSVSSQFLTGLLLALPLLPGDSTVTVRGRLESEDYIRITEKTLSLAGIRYEAEQCGEGTAAVRVFRLPGGQCPRLPAEVSVEKDWTAAANFLVMGAFSKEGITVRGLDPVSVQGDRKILEILKDFNAQVEVLPSGDIRVRAGLTAFPDNGAGRLYRDIDAAMIPDLMPILSVLAALTPGETRISGAARLRLKETDRLMTATALLNSLGTEVRELPDGLLIRGKARLSGGTVPVCHDHRIAMAAAVSAVLSALPVTIPDAGCVGKSYPAFFEDFDRLEIER